MTKNLMILKKSDGTDDSNLLYLIYLYAKFQISNIIFNNYLIYLIIFIT